ncbi:Uncharacterized protein Fot_42415 [Forsythia ovata]|uniref:Uncharacterized protein n=1 Tax=Forsythia ovata TaxID=205694 RepID=A0ABD1RL43_9LAMI
MQVKFQRPIKQEAAAALSHSGPYLNTNAEQCRLLSKEKFWTTDKSLGVELKIHFGHSTVGLTLECCTLLTKIVIKDALLQVKGVRIDIGCARKAVVEAIMAVVQLKLNLIETGPPFSNACLAVLKNDSFRTFNNWFYA